jgi:hypothetical protein
MSYLRSSQDLPYQWPWWDFLGLRSHYTVQLHITDIVVKLEALDDKRSIPDRGFLTLRLESDFGAVASKVVPQAAKISSATSAPKILTVADSVVDSAPDASVVISAAQDVLAPVQTLIESLDPIVEVLNELAKVLNLSVTVLTWYSDNITPGPSFCQHRLGGCVLALQGKVDYVLAKLRYWRGFSVSV